MIRWTRDNPCPACGGWQSLPRGHGIRCYGFLSDCGQYAHCTREDRAGALEMHAESGTYSHRLEGECRCGMSHDARVSVPSVVVTRSPGRRRGSVEPLGTVDCYYLYRNAEGTPVHRTVRFRDPKSFRQQRRAESEWRWGLGDIRPVLYRLPELLAAPPDVPVFFPEGEKDVDRLTSLGLVATTHPMGAKSWRDHYATWLRGRHVVLLEDNDADGRAHTDAASRSLRTVAASVQAIRFPHLPPGGDVSDWLASGGSADLLLQRVDVRQAIPA